MDYDERMDEAKRVLGRCRVVKKGEEKRSRKGRFRKVDSVIAPKNSEMTRSRYYSCERKDRYKTMGEATKHMHVLMTIRPGTRLRIYWCDFCGGYHITSKPPQKGG